MKKINCILFSLGCFLCILLMQCAPVDQTQQPGVQAQSDPPPPPPPPPSKPEWYWSHQDENDGYYKVKLANYANNHMDSTTKHIMQDIANLRIGVSTWRDGAGHIADATAPLDFANGEVTRMKVDTILMLLRIDTVAVIQKYIDDHPELSEGTSRKK